MSSPKRESEVALFVCHDLIGLMATNELVPKLKEMGCNPVIINTGMARNRRPIVPAPPGPSFHMAGIVNEVLLPFLDNLSPGQLSDRKHLSYKHLAQTHELRYMEIADVNDPDFIEGIKQDSNLVGGISIRFLQVFGRDVINTFEEKGFLWNLHGGLLPQYQGLLIPYRAIDNKERDYGWTLHKMAEKIDAGDIIDEVKRPLDRLSSIFNTYSRMIPYGVTMVVDAFNNFRATSSYPYTPQSPEVARYYPYPTSEEMQRYETTMGITFVGELATHINTVVQTFLEPTSKEGRLLKKRLCEATIAHQQANERNNFKSDIPATPTASSTVSALGLAA